MIMDDCTKDLLKSWNLEILIDHFKENCIDKNSMAGLTSDLIKELIPQIGLRIQFLTKWQEHFNETKNITVTNERDENVDLDTTRDISSDENTDKENSVSLHRQNSAPLSRQNCFVGSTVFRKLQRSSVKDILNLSSQGRAILKLYEKKKLLNRKCRNIIVDLILSEILNNIHGPLRNEDFYSLSKEIEELFPTETSCTYYIPPIAKRYSRNNKSVTARGKLIDKYRNKIRDYKKLTGQSVTDLSSSSPSASTSTSYNSELEDDSVIRESISWLESNLSPWQLVQQHWKITLAYRRNEIQSSQNKSVTEIFSKWPVLKHPAAYTLIEEDFKFLKLTTEDCINHWFNFFSQVRELCPLNEDKVTNELCSLQEANDIKDDTKVLTQILLLPHLLPPKGRIRVKKQHYKSSISECKNSIILHAKIHGDINRIQEEKRKKAQSLGLTIQPYIIVVGPTLSEITGFYVCVDKVLYQVSTALAAIDICFKIFHVFDVNYPPESEHIWYVVQRSLYKFSTKYDKQISYVMPIINSLEMLNSTND